MIIIKISQLTENMNGDTYFDLITEKYFYIHPDCFDKDFLKNLVPKRDHPLFKTGNYYQNTKTGEFYLVPLICFERDSLDDLICVPNYYSYKVKFMKEFMKEISKRYSGDKKMIKEINRLMQFDENLSFQLDHDFQLFTHDFYLLEEWGDFSYEKATQIAIEWCNANGFRYRTD